jgi:GlcNAc-P-P-Und epimerase
MEKTVSESIIIFGGSGFIGRHLAGKYLDDGYRVILCDIVEPNWSHRNVQFIRCDVRNPISLDLDTEVSIVFNFAAVHRTPGHEEHEYFETNIRGAENVTAFCEAKNIKTLVFTSSISVYSLTEELCTEQSTPQPVSAYGKSKLAAEAIHQAWLNRNDTHKLVVVRPAVIFGPHEGGNFTMLARKLRSRLFAYPGRKDTIKSCGYVKDLVRSLQFVLALNRPYSLFNFAYPERFTTEDICNAFHEAVGFDVPRLVVPKWAILLAARPFEIAARLGIVQTKINRARVMKLILSTNVFPEFLVAEKFSYAFPLTAALRDWQSETNFNE